ncbi:MAG: NAD(P)/FAD-dependent oxidoreductase [Rubricoccaceae bacterium]
MPAAPPAYDLAIAGAGPGGAACAAFAARAGLRVLLVDKAPAFPRDKICGDALSGKTVDVMKRLGMTAALQARPQVASWGVTFSGPYGDAVSIPFAPEAHAGKDAPGYVCDRATFDALVLEEALAAGAELWTGASVTGLVREGAAVRGLRVRRGGEETDVRAALTVGADGAYSAVARALGIPQLDERHYCAGLRWYWEGVQGFGEGNYIEIHFVDEAIPGYFWIFPMAGGRANVGLGMLSSEVKRRGVRLKPLLEQVVASERFRERFAGGRPLEPMRGWGLPLGSKPRPMTGDGWLLVGDAAGLIDPFTGEGIGNAMVSGEIAARWAARVAATGDASARHLSGYRRDVLGYLGSELRVSHALQKLGQRKRLLNFVIARAARRPAVAEAISVMFHDEAARKKLFNPLFYLRLLRT